jgi:hypothetical protein
VLVSKSRIFSAALTAVLVTSFLVAASQSQAAPNVDRFQPTSVTWALDGGISDLASPQIFETAAQAHPVSLNQVLFSRCRTHPFNSSSLYSSFSGNVINQDSSSFYSDGTSCGSPQNEQNIVINPSDPSNIVTSANDYRYGFGACWAYVSKDSGATWQNIQLPGWTSTTDSNGVYSQTGCGGDPVLAFSPDGKSLYFSSLTYGAAKNATGKAFINKSGLAVAASHDGGLTWSNPSMIDYQATANVFIDKQWISAANDGTVYATWTQFNANKTVGYLNSPIVFSSSSNGGKSWTPVRAVSDASHPYNQGSQVGVTPSGALVVAYEGSSATSTNDELIVAESRNGGATFTNTEVSRIYDDASCYPTQLPGAQGRPTLTNEQFRINSFPTMAIDPTTGKVAVVWADNRGSGNCGSSDTSFTGTATSNQVYLVTANDQPSGQLFSASQVATPETHGVADKVYPSVAANVGKISIGYYTRAYSPPVKNDPERVCGISEANVVNGSLDLLNLVAPTDHARAIASVCLDYAAVSSSDNYATETRLTAQSSNPYIQFAGAFIGDYTGAAMDSSGGVWFVWTDFRGKPGVTNPNEDTVVKYLNSVK